MADCVDPWLEKATRFHLIGQQLSKYTSIPGSYLGGAFAHYSCPVSEFPLDGDMSAAVLPHSGCTGACSDIANPQLSRSFLQREGEGWCDKMTASAFAIQSNTTLKFLCASDPQIDGLSLLGSEPCWSPKPDPWG
mgnify:CR=1 FL=1